MIERRRRARAAMAEPSAVGTKCRVVARSLRASARRAVR